MVKIDLQASFKRHLLTGVALLGLMGSASGAFAADAAKADATINEVVITAQHRQENVQKVAIAITAMSADELSAQGVIGFRELGTRLPSLRFGAGVTGGENVITMRGLGSQNTTPGGDSPVAYNIDGVYVQRTTAIDPEFYDIARVEVLRGPQGTLYGRTILSPRNRRQASRAAPMRWWETMMRAQSGASSAVHWLTPATLRSLAALRP